MEPDDPAAATGRNGVVGESTRLLFLLESLDSRSFRLVHWRQMERTALIVASVVGGGDSAGTYREMWTSRPAGPIL